MKTDIFKIEVPEGIASLVPYPPGKPIEELERELGIEGSIKLASNENPLGPSKKAIEAISGEGFLGNLHRYPDGSAFYLKNRLAKLHGVVPSSIAIGNGSNEIIELLIRTYLGSGNEAVMGDPSFAVYPLVVQSVGGESVMVPLKGLTHDLKAIREAVTDKTRLIFITNPNNPTGTIVSRDEMTAFLDSLPEGVITVLDEAYFEYVKSDDNPDGIQYVKEGRAVIALRTFSKIYGLAGLRIGYGIAPPEIIDYLERVRQPFNVNSVALAAALAAIDDEAHVSESRRVNSEGIEYLFGELKKLGLESVPTEANFFLVRVGDGKGVYEGLLKRGVIVRPMAGYGLGEYIRVTVGIRAENERFIKAATEVVGQML